MTCKSHADDAAIVDGAAAAKAAAGKVGKHRDLVLFVYLYRLISAPARCTPLAGNPDNRFLPFAVEEGGRIGTDAEAYIDAIVRAGSADPATWCATKTYCMRALAITTAKGIARVLTRRRHVYLYHLISAPPSRPPRRPSSNGPKPPSATSLAHLAHITTPLDRAHDAVAPAPRAAEDSFYASTTTSLMQSAAAMVGA